jgi:ABC-type multidrug transport system ATPase subunit
LDAASDQSVIEALDKATQGRTSVVIAHHLGTIRHADVIFVVKDCELVEPGTHETLLAKDGVYAELYRIQTPEGVKITTAEPVVTRRLVPPERGVSPCNERKPGCIPHCC